MRNYLWHAQLPVSTSDERSTRLGTTAFTGTPDFDVPGTGMSQLATFGVSRGAGASRAIRAAARAAF